MVDSDETREHIFQIIKNHPGIHFRGIVTESNRQIGVVEYHLRVLEQSKRIVTIRHRRNKLFFDSSWKQQLPEVKTLVSNLRKTLPRAILLLLSQYPETQEICIKDLAKVLNRPPSSLHWHINNLIRDQLITTRRIGREVVLELLIEKQLINHLGQKVYPTRWDKFLDDIDHMFFNLFTGR